MNIRHLIIIAILPFLFACQDDKTANTNEGKKAPNATEVANTENSSAEQTKPANNTVASNHEGEPIHKKSCAECHMAPHDAAFYQRPNSKMNSYERLQSQVRLCNANLELDLFDEDMSKIGEYLNESYYKFPTN